MLFLDTDVILSTSQHWKELDEKWGEPVDLDCCETRNTCSGRIRSACSAWSLNQTTFDSAKYIKKLKRAREAAKQLQESLDDYEVFTEGISQEEVTSRPFYFIAGSIMSEMSIENICENIDVMFEYLETTRAATSTVRAAKKTSFPSIIKNSIASMSNLSFDDTVEEPSHVHGTTTPRTPPKISSTSLQDILAYIDQMFDLLQKI